MTKCIRFVIVFAVGALMFARNLHCSRFKERKIIFKIIQPTDIETFDLTVMIWSELLTEYSIIKLEIEKGNWSRKR